MPRFHFHVHDGRSTLDTEGSELPSLDHARLEAVRFAGKLMDEEARRIADGEDWHLEVADETGLVLFRLDILATTAPAGGSGRKA